MTETKEKAKDAPAFDEKAAAKLDENPLFNFGPPLIQTAEDATQAFLHGLITEDELKAALGRFGVTPGLVWQTPATLERVDAAYERTLPEEFFVDRTLKIPPVSERIAAANEKTAAKEAASKESEKAASK